MRTRFPGRKITKALTERQRYALCHGLGDGQSAQGVLDRGLGTHATAANSRGPWVLHLNEVGLQWQRDLRRIAARTEAT